MPSVKPHGLEYPTIEVGLRCGHVVKERFDSGDAAIAAYRQILGTVSDENKHNHWFRMADIGSPHQVVISANAIEYVYLWPNEEMGDVSELDYEKDDG